MTCNCVCKCTNEADGVGLLPTMCSVCALLNGLNDPAHALPYTPPVFTPIEPSVPIPREQLDRIFKAAADENFG